MQGREGKRARGGSGAALAGDELFTPNVVPTPHGSATASRADASAARMRLANSCATGLAAALLAVYQPIHPTAGLVFGLTAFIIVAMGGFGSIAGAFVAAMLVGLLENVAGFYLDPAYKHLWVFLLFIVVLVWRPQGLLGRR